MHASTLPRPAPSRTPFLAPESRKLRCPPPPPSHLRGSAPPTPAPLPFSCSRAPRQPSAAAVHKELFRTMTPPRTPHLRARCRLLLASLSACLLAGCGVTASQLASTSTTLTPQTATLQGRVHGGQQVVEGAHIYLFAASTYGYGYNSVSLLNGNVAGVYTDALGGYVLTDQNGNFNLSGAYSCAAGQQIYILAQGGNPGLAAGTDNAALTMISILGACPSDGTFAGHIAYVNINEVSTVGAAFALAGFMTDVTHVAAPGSPAAQLGLANAFATFANLVDLGSGEPRIISASQGNGTVPASKINSLADVLSPCINSNGSALVCTALFNAAHDAAGGIPTETTTAALNIAHNPSLNVATLWNIISPTPPFQPSLTIAPNDWSLAVTYRAQFMQGPYYPAIDSAGDLWVPGYATNNLFEFDPLGNNLSGAHGFSGGSLAQPYAIAIDSADNALVVNFNVSKSTISRFSAGGTPSSTTYACPGECFFPAVDTSGNLWISGKSQTVALSSSGGSLGSFPTTSFNSGISLDTSGRAWTLGTGSNLYRQTLPSTTSTYTRSTTSPANDTTPTAMDSAGNLWFTSLKNNALGKTGPNGVAISPTGGYTGGGLNAPAGLAVDGGGNVWVTNRASSTLSEFSNAGTAITPTSALTDTLLSGPRGIAIDASGNIRVPNSTRTSAPDFIGAATPTATPITPTNHGQRP